MLSVRRAPGRAGATVNDLGFISKQVSVDGFAVYVGGDGAQAVGAGEEFIPETQVHSVAKVSEFLWRRSETESRPYPLSY
jgi:hypothetical protein